ncbi:hypothetical protein XENORESO_010791 [Xenotaenia resolanae]|uniref:Uncharacterized protein n=1 Tax=Xenotaenia resolanae TaxID=208358 RepID=A0ABV0W7W0_9TELE
MDPPRGRQRGLMVQRGLVGEQAGRTRSDWRVHKSGCPAKVIQGKKKSRLVVGGSKRISSMELGLQAAVLKTLRRRSAGEPLSYSPQGDEATMCTCQELRTRLLHP